MNKPNKKSIFIRIAKYTGITLVSLLVLLFLIPILFPGTIAQQVKDFANKKLTGELEFKEAKLSFFQHFPSLTVTLEDFSLKGSAPFEKETLVSAEDISFGINLKQLIFDGNVIIDEIYVGNSLINVLINKQGQANYNVYISDETENSKDTVSNTALRLDKIKISNCTLKYDDKATGLYLAADGFNYLGKGDLDQSVFDLKSKAEFGSMNFAFADQSYLLQKNVTAELITRINTNALTFEFSRNDLRINKLPIQFKGIFNILQDGYFIDLAVESLNSDLEDLFTALPPEYVTWLDSSKVKGKIDMALTLKGRYDVKTQRSPTLSFLTKIENGYIKHNKSEVATSDIKLNLNVIMPDLNPESLDLKMDDLTFKLGKETFRSYASIQGLSKMKVKALFKGGLDLEALNRSLGIKGYDIKGRLNADIVSEGIYNASTQQFPKTTGKIDWKNGYLKTPFYPNPIQNIDILLTANNTDGSFQNTKISLNSQLKFENETINAVANFSQLNDVIYDVKAKGVLNIGKIYRVFASEGMDIDGKITADVNLKGKQSDATNGHYAKLDNKGRLEVEKITAKMDAFPKNFLINQGIFTFDKQNMNFDQFAASYGESDFNLNGKLKNVINYVFEKNATLSGDFDLTSNYINVDEFLAVTTKDTIVSEAETTESGVAMIPKNLNVKLKAHAKKIKYDTFQLDDLKGIVGLEEGKLRFQNAQLGIIGATLGLNGFYADKGPKEAEFDLRFKADNFQIERAFKEIEMFRELASSAGNAQGIVSMDYNLKGILNQEMSPVYPSLEGNGVIKLNKIKVKGLKLFTGLSQKTGSEKLNNPDLSEVDIKSNIKNNVITIEETKMKIALFRLKFQGQTNFDGQLGLKIRVGLPPLGLIGIPVAVTGTQDNPNIKVFSKTTEGVEETQYSGNANDSIPTTPKPNVDATPKSESDSIPTAEPKAVEGISN